MAKVEMVGMKTIMMPLTTPGMESGKTTFQNTWEEPAPRSWAASM